MSINAKTRPTFTKLGGKIGAEVGNIDLKRSIDPEIVEEIRSAINQFGVLIFRDQHGLDDAGQERILAALGEPVHHPTVSKDIGADVNSTGYFPRANTWHSDATFVSDFPQYASLRPIILPEAGGGTAWANMVAAYADLPPPLRVLADNLWALHTNDPLIIHKPSFVGDHYLSTYSSTIYETNHPVVHIIPETGDRALLLGSRIHRFSDFQFSDSQVLLALLYRYVNRPENTLHWRWKLGDFALYSNRTTHHYAIDDYGHSERKMRAVRTRGEAPVSIDGQRSQTRIVRGPAPLDKAA